MRESAGSSDRQLDDCHTVQFKKELIRLSEFAYVGSGWGTLDSNSAFDEGKVKRQDSK
jgi:hypothetical protein